MAEPMNGFRTAGILPVETRGLVFEAGGRRLIDGIDLTIGPGAVTAIVGPNGAGKSLTLRLLHGLIAPTAGEVLWAGRPADAAVRRRQAMVFQRPVLLRRSAAANIRHALRARGISGAEARARAAEALSLAGLDHLAGVPARVMSGGEQQRLAVARAMALRPDILFLDEPTASLDPASTLAVEALIGKADRAGTKIVLVTHDLGQARRLADDVIFLVAGRVEAQRTIDRFFTDPESERARAFIEGRIVL
jgi:tungstate transport system ATP-binding protein